MGVNERRYIYCIIDGSSNRRRDFWTILFLTRSYGIDFKMRVASVVRVAVYKISWSSVCAFRGGIQRYEGREIHACIFHLQSPIALNLSPLSHCPQIVRVMIVSGVVFFINLPLLQSRYVHVMYTPKSYFKKRLFSQSISH